MSWLSLYDQQSRQDPPRPGGWLSLYSLSYRDALKLRLKDSYSVHRVVYGLFPPEINRGARILYADKGFQNGYRKILILSGHAPALGEYGSIQSKAVPEIFLEFEAYNFEIVVNPARRSNATGRLEPVRSRDGIRKWFEERSENWGFTCLHLDVGSIWVDSFHKSADRQVTLAKAKITGSLGVRDRGLFENSFRNGLGRGRAFGCGLLQLQPVVITN